MSLDARSSEDTTQAVVDSHRRGPDSKEGSDEAAALDLLWTTFFAANGRTCLCKRCGDIRVFHRVTKRRAYACDRCGTHIYPAAGTPFARSAIPVAYWLTALSMRLQSPQQPTARQISERLGITYRTAWSMSRRIERSLAAEGREARLLHRLAASWSQRPFAREEKANDAHSPEDRICAATCRVMAERGLSATRISDIASEAGLSSASIHYYFRSKDDALLAGFHWACERSNRAMKRLREDRGVDPVEHVRQLLELGVPRDRTMQNEYQLWLEVWARARNHPQFLGECMRMSGQWFESVREILNRGITEGAFRPVAPLDEICTRYVAMSESLSYRMIIGYEDMPEEKARRVLARFTAEQLGIPLDRLGV
jgi:AcrR family transcriptional regulator